MFLVLSASAAGVAIVVTISSGIGDNGTAQHVRLPRAHEREEVALLHSLAACAKDIRELVDRVPETLLVVGPKAHPTSDPRALTFRHPRIVKPPSCHSAHAQVRVIGEPEHLGFTSIQGEEE